ncbi:MFS transporter [Tengunoibacter tsumagoiensis]|uniref:MFS transporter n=1 Tax=Tengunoibacter tsumagoiensis TaxID=2014871 RepID=A0A402A5G5_9CHLR|nr:MFS transporter [Tengunoibacter tsumagoiensis]GCE14296.1 MFS transporter [Tengunoibacter tsumagoiensis]
MSIPTEQTEKAIAQDQQANVASFRQVLKNRNFLLLWLAQLISLTILNAANFGLIVLVNELPNKTFMAGLAIIAFTLPAIPFSAIAGVVVDRMDKRLVMWVSNLLRMFTMLLMFASLLYDHTNVWSLFGLMFLTSLIGQFFIPAEGSAIPLLVGEGELMPALSLFNVSLTLSQALGFLILGSIITKLFPPFTIHFGSFMRTVQSTDTMFLIVAVLYAVCVVLILCIPAKAFAETHLRRQKNEVEIHTTYDAAKSALYTLWRDIMGGWRIIRSDRLLFFSVIQLSVVGILMQLIGQLAGTFVQEILKHPPTDMSLVLAPAAIGLVGASIFMTKITARVDRIHLTTIGFISLAVGFIVLPALELLAIFLDPAHGQESLWLLILVVTVLILLGVAMACVNIPTNTIMQERAPDAGRARVLSLQFMIYSAGTIPVLLFAGAFATFIGFNQLIVVVSVSLLLFCWWGVRYIKGHTNDPKVDYSLNEDEEEIEANSAS